MPVDREWWNSLDVAWKAALQKSLEFEGISDAALEKIRSTRHLNVAKAPITSLAPAKELASLEVVDFSGCELLKSFVGLPPSVRVATFHWLAMDDLSWVDALPNLESVYGDKDLQRKVKLRIGKNRKAGVTAAPAAAPASGTQAVGVAETVLCTLSAKETLGRSIDLEFHGGSAGIAPGVKRATFVRLDTTKGTVFVENGKRGTEWESFHTLGFTPDGSHIAYVAGADKKERLVIGKEELPPADKVLDYTFSQAGSPAWVAKVGKKMQVVEPGKEHSPFEFVCNLAFDDAGQLHYDANRGGTPDKHIQDKRPTTSGQWFHIAGGKEVAITYEKVGTTKLGRWDYSAAVWPTVRDEVPGEERLRLQGDEEILGHPVRLLKQGKSAGVSVDGTAVGGAFDKVHLVVASKRDGWIRFFVKRGNDVVMLEHKL